MVEVKKKHPGRVAAGKKLAEWNRNNRVIRNKITLKSFLNDIRQDLNDPTSILTVIDETIRILEENKIEIQITLKKI